MIFDTLPHVINQNIGSFLDYNSRMEFSRVLTSVEDRFVRKLNSDEHNFAVTTKKLKSYLDGAKHWNMNNRIDSCYKMFNYLANTKDTIVFDLTKFKKLREAAIVKLTEFSDHNYYQYLYCNKSDKIKLLMISSKALHRLKTYVPKKELNIKRQLIEII